MNPDDLQQAWQAHSKQTRLMVDADLLQQEVRRSQENFRMTILLRDCREAGISLLMIPIWVVMGVKMALPWSWYLMIPGLIFVIGFIVLDRWRHPQKPIGPDEPLLRSVEESLRQVEHQIWLLRNVIWWYLMPFTIPLLTFFAHGAWMSSDRNWLAAIGIAIPFFVFLFVVYGFIHYINQRAVRKQLEPRRQELLAIIGRLGDEPASEDNSEITAVTHRQRANISPWRLAVGFLCFLAIMFIGVPAIFFVAARLASVSEDDYPKLSPFAAVRWEEAQPHVQIGTEWFTLVSLNGIPAEEIVSFSQETFEERWRKRFEEDLVELLTRMGRPPGDTVTLQVQPLGSQDIRTLEDVPMTRANRQAIRNAAQAREGRAQAPLAEVVPELRREYRLVGLAAMVMTGGEVIDAAADGERKIGSGVPLTIDDQWHVGSVTKSITATMIARLVESGRMQWSGTVGDVFPDVTVDERWKPVTLRQLLTHTAGAPANFPLSVRRKNPPLGPESTEARRNAVFDVLAKKPPHPPGETMTYSNVGYTIAGAMAEAATGKTWDALVRREVFEPLALEGAGFGPPASPNKTFDQPRGHRRFFGRRIAAGDTDDNTTIMGPAGTARMTLKDACVYANEHLRGARGEGALLSAETFEWLHTPEQNQYACGWVRQEPGASIPHTVYWHNGSNTMWYALVVFIPDINMAVAVTSNDGAIANAEAAAWDIVRASVARFAGEAARDPVEVPE